MRASATALSASLAAFAAAAALAGTATASRAQPPPRGVADPIQARADYMLKCQGCHRPEGGGDLRTTPPMRGSVAKFLSVPGGREYLGRVPGVATTDLDDARLAGLLNWTLYRFDPANLPDDFRAYTAAEIGHLRRAPLRTEASRVRAELIARMPDGESPGK
ncbi:cytochrome C [Phenylobacterium sp.]|uniref:cytochrome C n=1 Tax=Phenylobacterium sp. TaxID=1871053 RepID=UPI002FCB3B7E